MTCDSGQEHEVYYYVHRTCGMCPESDSQVLLWLHPSVLKFVWSDIICFLYYEIVTHTHVTMNYNQVKNLKLVNVYLSSIDIFNKIRGLLCW